MRVVDGFSERETGRRGERRGGMRVKRRVYEEEGDGGHRDEGQAGKRTGDERGMDYPFESTCAVGPPPSKTLPKRLIITQIHHDHVQLDRGPQAFRRAARGGRCADEHTD